MNLPKRRQRPRMNVREPSQIRCASHLKFIRSFVCCLAGREPRACTGDAGWNGYQHECEGIIEAAHVRTGTDGGTSLKPSDSFTIPLCSLAHKRQHQIGEPAFEKEWGIDMKAIAKRLWEISPARKRYEAKLQEKQGGSTE